MLGGRSKKQSFFLKKNGSLLKNAGKASWNWGHLKRENKGENKLNLAPSRSESVKTKRFEEWGEGGKKKKDRRRGAGRGARGFGHIVVKKGDWAPEGWKEKRGARRKGLANHQSCNSESRKIQNTGRENLSERGRRGKSLSDKGGRELWGLAQLGGEPRTGY